MPVITKGKRQLSCQLSEEVMRALDAYRHKRMFNSKTDAVETLLRAGLKANPPKPEDAK